MFNPSDYCLSCLKSKLLCVEVTPKAWSIKQWSLSLRLNKIRRPLTHVAVTQLNKLFVIIHVVYYFSRKEGIVMRNTQVLEALINSFWHFLHEKKKRVSWPYAYGIFLKKALRLTQTGCYGFINTDSSFFSAQLTFSNSSTLCFVSFYQQCMVLW